MNQQAQTQFTTVKKRTRTKNGKPTSVQNIEHSMIAAKKNNIPSSIESDDKKLGVIKWGKNNEYPYFLNYLAKNNPIHSGIIRAKVNFTVSGGLQYEGADAVRYQEFYNNKKKTHKDKNLDDLMRDISLNFEKSNMFVFRVRFSFVGEKSYRKIECIPFERVRFEIQYDEANKPFETGNICVSKDWLTQNPTFEVLKPYNKQDPQQTECFVLHQEESGQAIEKPDGVLVNPGFYPDPPYSGAITAIDTGIQIGTYQNSEIANGFVLGTMAYFANGKFKNDQDKRRFENDLGDASTGASQAGRLFAVYGNGQDQKPEILPLNGNNLPDRYNNTKDGSEESTVHGHQVVVPSLFGMKPDGSFNASELEIGYAIMQANYFEERRASILSVLNWVMNSIAEIAGEIVFGEAELKLPKEENYPATAMNINLSSETKEQTPDVILNRLKLMGQDKDKFDVIFSRSIDNGELSRTELINEAKSAFADLSDNAQRTLGLIRDGEPFNEIRKALDISGNDLAQIYQELIQKELITKTGEMTTAGRRQVAVSEIESIEIMYEYRLRPDAPALVPGGESREFCQTLISLNRLYTLEDINTISGVEGYSVLNYRGGWYHNPNSGKNEPSCRHEWAQVVTFGNK